MRARARPSGPLVSAQPVRYRAVSAPEEFFRRVQRAPGAVAPARTAGVAYWRAAWTGRHTLLAAALFAGLIPLSMGLTGWPGDPAILAVLVGFSAVAALVGASYLPARGVRGEASSCAAMPAVLTVVAIVLLGRSAADLGSVLSAALLVVPAVLLRLFGAASCSS